MPQAGPPAEDDFRLVQASQRGSLIITSIVIAIVGALALAVGIFSKAIGPGIAFTILGALFLVAAAFTGVAVALASWWQFESRQQLGLLARGLSEHFGDSSQ
jgi:hypothetical protein